MIGKIDLFLEITILDRVGFKNSTERIGVIFNKISPPFFEETLPEQIEFLVGEARTFKFPGIDTGPYKRHPERFIEVLIPFSMRNYLTFDESSMELFWSDDL